MGTGAPHPSTSLSASQQSLSDLERQVLSMSITPTNVALQSVGSANSLLCNMGMGIALCVERRCLVAARGFTIHSSTRLLVVSPLHTSSIPFSEIERTE
jgi:hypothetical protein